MLIFYRGFINEIKIYYTIKVSPEILYYPILQSQLTLSTVQICYCNLHKYPENNVFSPFTFP